VTYKEDVLTEERFSRKKFIRLGAALGVSAAGASVVAACGSGGEEGAEQSGGGGGGEDSTGDVGGAPEAGGGETVAQVQSGTAIAQESDVAQGSALEFTDEEGGQPAVLVHLESGDFVAYSAVCTHRQCTVGYSEGNLSCPCHGSVFDPTSGGAVVNGPATQPLPEIPVEVRDGEVFRA
jgi:cytochrome b6-f complex iron-sulfur subunit